jgi:hypothetical protein
MQVQKYVLTDSHCCTTYITAKTHVGIYLNDCSENNVQKLTTFISTNNRHITVQKPVNIITSIAEPYVGEMSPISI